MSVRDRPAAELLAELRQRRQIAEKLDAPRPGAGEYEKALVRLTLAEQTLSTYAAAIARVAVLHCRGAAGYCDGCELLYPCGTVEALRAPSGAS